MTEIVASLAELARALQISERQAARDVRAGAPRLDRGSGVAAVRTWRAPRAAKRTRARRRTDDQTTKALRLARVQRLAFQHNSKTSGRRSYGHQAGLTVSADFPAK